MIVDINPETLVCISVSEHPSSFGMTVHNAAFRHCGLNYVYKSFRVTDIFAAMAAVRALGIRGCGVSMPFKESVIPSLDALDQSARDIKSVNTVVNCSGRLIGYNTDAYGAMQSLRELGLSPDIRVLILGAGGAARAVVYALSQLGFRAVTVMSRTMEKAVEVGRSYSYRAASWMDLDRQEVDLLINATPIGMSPLSSACPVEQSILQRCKAVMDLVVSPLQSELISRANAMGLMTAPGYRMSLHQAAKQFHLYTGEQAPLPVMEEALIDMLRRR